jgi:hypothetical protein
MSVAAARLLEPGARLISPRTRRSVAKIEQPVFPSEPALASLFIS